jgi:hypothetical protein
MAEVDRYGRQRGVLDEALGGLGGEAVRYFGGRADANEDLLRKLALMRATEAQGERSLNQQAGADFAQEEFFAQPREEQQHRSVIAQAMSPSLALPTPPTMHQGDPRVEAFQRRHGPITAAIDFGGPPPMSEGDPSERRSPLTIEDARRGAGAETALSRPRFTGPEITAQSRLDAARINASERAARGQKEQPYEALVTDEQKLIRQNLATRKVKGRLPGPITDQDVQIQGELNAALKYESSGQYPDAIGVAQLARGLLSVKDNPQAGYQALLALKAKYEANPAAAEKQYGKRYKVVLDRLLLSAAKPGFWANLAGAGLGVDVPVE